MSDFLWKNDGKIEDTEKYCMRCGERIALFYKPTVYGLELDQVMELIKFYESRTGKRVVDIPLKESGDE